MVWSCCFDASASSRNHRRCNTFGFIDKSSIDIKTLRELHIKIDQTVALGYCWTDLELSHGFHETKQGVRYTISESARREVLKRLLKLHHERYAEEVKQGLHGKKGGAGRVKGGGKGKAAAGDAESVVPATKRRASKKPAKSTNSDAHAVAEERSLFSMDDDDVPEVASGEQREESEVKEAVTDNSDAETETPTRPHHAPPDTDDVMAVFRQATRGRGSLERDELLKNVATILGYQRLGAKIEETLRGHLRAAIRRHIIEADGASMVRAGTASMADFTLEELRDVFVSVMRKNTRYEREDVIQAVARHLGFSRVTDNSREAIKSAINSGIRQDVLAYEGSEIWRVG